MFYINISSVNINTPGVYIKTSSVSINASNSIILTYFIMISFNFQEFKVSIHNIIFIKYDDVLILYLTYFLIETSRAQ